MVVCKILTALHVKCQMLQVIHGKNVTIIDLKLQLHQQYLWADTGWEAAWADLPLIAAGQPVPPTQTGTDH